MKHLTTPSPANLLCVLCILCALCAKAQPWQDQNVIQINRLPARAAFFPFASTPGDRQLSLNGQWKFRWAPRPEKLQDAAWTTIRVPANWEVNGFGTPIYSSSGYTFKVNPPYVMDEPKPAYTAYEERNPTGEYLRSFTLPNGWDTDGGRTILRFDGVMSAFFVVINGKDVGYSQGSNHPSEFDVTPYLHAGSNDIRLTVYKYSDGSYLEDQDAWRFGGIHRDVTIFHTPALHIRDFTVRTVASSSKYDAFRLQINPRLQSSNNADAAGYTVRAILSDADGQQIATMNTGAEDILNINHKAAVMNEWFPQRGRMKFERIDTLLYNIRAWTAETPYLYTLRLQLIDPQGNITEQAQQKVGFRQLDIRNGQLLVNGQPIRFRGVNRVEHDPYTAKAVSEERMLEDIRLMKTANINAVRTAHAPASPRWYDLCDSLGLYVLDEADCENHGVRGEFTSTPSWNTAMMDRVIRLAERDKNHPCVVFWSLGNESGFGANHSAMAGWLHEFDPTRFVHYEGAQGSPDPSCVDVIARFYPRVKQDYLNPGIEEGSDKERAENARWERLLEIAERTDTFSGNYLSGVVDNRPVMTSEYAHCMGNALGNFQEYWDEIYSNPRMLGGFIWDWVDQGIMVAPHRLPRGGEALNANIPSETTDNKATNNNSPSDKAYQKTLPLGGVGGGPLYGGDFGDKPNLKAFCLNGVVKCDRQLTSKYYEVQHVYAPVQFSRHNGSIYIINRNHHTALDAYQISGQYVVNGKAQKAFSVAVPDVAPNDSARLTLPQPKAADGHILLNLTVSRDGQKVTDEQFEIHGTVMDYVHTVTSHHKGGLGGLDLSSLRCSFFRAPTDNDKSFGNWLAKDWTKNRIDSPTVAVIEKKLLDDGTMHSVEEYKFVNGSVIVTTDLTPLPTDAQKAKHFKTSSPRGGREGTSTDLTVTFTIQGDVPDLPRLGIQLMLPKEYEQLEYYGRGPWDTYPDRWHSCHIGLWHSTVTNEYAHFPVPQDCGNHGETSAVTLATKAGRKLQVIALDEPFSFSALHYTPQDIAAVKHDYELREGDYTVLSIDCAVLGIGNSSCGPGVLKKYSIDRTKPHTLHLRIIQ